MSSTDRPVIIGLFSHRPGSGKSTAADHLTGTHGFREISIGAMVKSEVAVMFEALGLSYSEEDKETLRPVLSAWTAYRLAASGDDYWLGAAISVELDDVPLVFSDLRYPNELAWVSDHGGRLIRIHRESARQNDLPTETALAGYDGDVVIDNSAQDMGRYLRAALDDEVTRVLAGRSSR